MANINLKAYNADGELVSVMDVSDPAEAQQLIKSAEETGFRVEATPEVAPSEAFATGILQGVSAEWADEALKRKDETKAAEAGSPVAYGAGNVIGSLVPGALAAGAGGLAGAKLGAMLGSAGGPIGALLGGAVGGGLATAAATAGAAEEGEASAGEMAKAAGIDVALGLIPAGAIAGRAKKVYEKARKLLGPVSEKQIAEQTAAGLAEEVSRQQARMAEASTRIPEIREDLVSLQRQQQQIQESVPSRASQPFAGSVDDVIDAELEAFQEKIKEITDRVSASKGDIEAQTKALEEARAAYEAAKKAYGPKYGAELAKRVAPLIGAAAASIGAGRRAADRPLDRAAADRAFIEYMRNRPAEISAKK